jgi:hypothetical protein
MYRSTKAGMSETRLRYFIMNTRRGQLYLAHVCTPEEMQEADSGNDDCVVELEPKKAAEYIASLLASLQPIAAKAQFRLLSDLIAVAEEEARFHCRA